MVNAIETDGLAKRFEDVTAVDDLSITLETGEVYGCLGLNGAGKTTTVRMLAGALSPTEGQARVLGVDVVENPREIAPNVGVVFGENISPEPSFSPVRYLRYFGALYGLDRSTVDERARKLFDLLDLKRDEERPIETLSGGNRRKVEIARALLHRPRLLFLDEPTRELDIPTKQSMWRLFRGLASELGVTIFLSSHDPQEIGTLCDRIGILQGGCLAWEGSSAELADGKDELVDALASKLTAGPTNPAARPS